MLHAHRSRSDEAYTALLIFIVSAFHGAAMIPRVDGVGERAAGPRSSTVRPAHVSRRLLGFGGSHGGTMTFTGE